MFREGHEFTRANTVGRERLQPLRCAFEGDPVRKSKTSVAEASPADLSARLKSCPSQSRFQQREPLEATSKLLKIAWDDTNPSFAGRSIRREKTW
jgi:hypothetical protein